MFLLRVYEESGRKQRTVLKRHSLPLVNLQLSSWFLYPGSFMSKEETEKKKSK